MNKKNKILCLLSSIFLTSVIGISISIGIENNNVTGASAYGPSDTTWYMTGEFNNWNKADANYHFTYSHDVGNNWQFNSDKSIAIESGKKWNVVYSWNSGSGYNTFTPERKTNETDFTINGDCLVASRNIKANFYLQIYGSGASWTGMYWTEVFSTISVTVASGQSSMGSVSASSTSVSYKGSSTLTATPNSGYNFVNWTKDGEVVSTDATYTITNITDSASYVGNFQPTVTQYTLTLDPKNGEATSTMQVTYNTAITTITPPTKLNNTFLGYYYGDTKYINADGTSAHVYDFTENKTFEAHWSLNNGTYLGGSFVNWSQDGRYVMELNSGTQYVVKGLTLAANTELRAYYENGNYGNVNTITWSHPSYKGEKSGNNCKVLVAATYDVYYDTTSGEFHLAVPSMPSNGYYFTVNGSIAKADMKKAESHSGYTGQEYKATFTVNEGQKIKAYFQDSSSATQYILTMLSDSLEQWSSDSDGYLLCPETASYSLYLIKNGQGGYDIVSIFKEGGEVANTFASEFNTQFCAVCAISSLETRKSNISIFWSQYKTSYDALNDNAKAYLTNTTALEDGKDLHEFGAKYDYIYTKYASELSLSNFASRTVTPKSVIVFPNLFTELTDATGNCTLIVLITTGVALMAFGGYFFLKKKKED